jgi:hypothetical protein
VQRAAEIAAQVFTARDAMLRDTPEDLRVAFLLFDSAAETLMYRRTSLSIELSFSSKSTSLERLGWTVVNVDLNDFEQKGRYPSEWDARVEWRLSETQKRNIEREFDSKAKFLAWDGLLPTPLVSTLKRLHQYRNEMYHREESRPEALRIVAHVYAWLVAELLERLGPGWFSSSSADPEDLLSRTLARMGRFASEGSDPFSRGLELQSEMAIVLREDLQLDDAPELLGRYVKSRVENMHEQVEFCGEYIGEVRQVGSLTEMQVIRLLYAEGPVTDVLNPSVREVPVKRASLGRWDAWHTRIRELSDPIDAFRSLAEFEIEFEDFEAKVREMALAIDREIQLQIDVARGK